MVMTAVGWLCSVLEIVALKTEEKLDFISQEKYCMQEIDI